MYSEGETHLHSENLENYFISSIYPNVPFYLFFHRGFKAIRKHKDKILLLVKMMYSIHGNTLPCFKGGEDNKYIRIRSN